jgi:hypothetical protein
LARFQYILISEYVKLFYTNLSATLFPLRRAAQNGFVQVTGYSEVKVSCGSVFGKVRIPLSPPKATLKCYYPSLRVIGVLEFPRLY